ncbi:MAG: cyclic pyranopterin monophosphate synthase MoaC [Bacteroidota bacterium]|jgi:cyclic pyranopterin phosphate synthase|nr:cyclic pyranopterin monophosphate synthase MoaC [Saprospiraceae bacterium]
MTDLSHINADGQAEMVNVGRKHATLRSAKARAVVSLPDEVFSALAGEGRLSSPKGDVFQVAILAGIMAAKKTGDLIPLCHPLGLDHCHVDIQLIGNEVIIDCSASLTSRTGVEMEAMVGASIAALTIYDMCKAVSHDIVVREIRLMEKTGGKRDFSRQT